MNRLNETLKLYAINNGYFFLHFYAEYFCLSKPMITIWDDRGHSGSVVECLTRDRGAVGSSLTGVTVLCPRVRHIYPCLELV